MKVICTEQLQTNRSTFRAGEEYIANEINEHWWVVDSIGVETEDFLLHFEVIEEDTPDVLTQEEAERGVNELTHRLVSYPEPDITLGWLDGYEENSEDDTWWDKLIDYIFV
jgi:hypothetical protein